MHLVFFLSMYIERKGKCKADNIRKDSGLVFGNVVVLIQGKEAKAMADQIRTVDKSRLKNKIG